ncbi:MAG: type II toxin-antitoxin system RelE/ParE family toxin [Rhodospirillales bacterium]|nr:MAG: type II toxin-antitoxin system RelE/ParE family toxin [Rhodospirillales bacterium]
MLRFDPSRQTTKFLRSVPEKHARQMLQKIQSLLVNPMPQDAKPLKGHPFMRTDSGEYRIIYRVEENKLHVALIGKRNDDEVYRLLRRMNR